MIKIDSYCLKFKNLSSRILSIAGVAIASVHVKKFFRICLDLHPPRSGTQILQLSVAELQFLILHRTMENLCR